MNWTLKPAICLTLAVLGFSVGISCSSYAANCNRVAASCFTWDANTNPSPGPGYCCEVDAPSQSTKACSKSDKNADVEDAGAGSCGTLKIIVNGACATETTTSCGGALALFTCANTDCN